MAAQKVAGTLYLSIIDFIKHEPSSEEEVYFNMEQLLRELWPG